MKAGVLSPLVEVALALVLSFLAVPLVFPAVAGSVQIIVADHPAAPVQFGVEELRRALQRKGLRVRIGADLGHGRDAGATASDPDGGFQIVLGDPEAFHLAGRQAYQPEIERLPESYTISIKPGRRVVVEGSDSTGVMYGALDVAEQVESATGNNAAAQIRPSAESPYLAIRGINMFFMTQDFDDDRSAFWSDEYWTAFLNMMARDRYNFLDIHGPCDAVTLTFPNAYSYFVSLPDFPHVGVGPARAARNIAQLRKIIRMATDHGVKVGYMNYEASPPIGSRRLRDGRCPSFGVYCRCLIKAAK